MTPVQIVNCTGMARYDSIHDQIVDDIDDGVRAALELPVSHYPLSLKEVLRIGQRIFSILDTNQLLAVVARLIQEEFACHHAALFLVDRRSGDIVLIECSGAHADEIKRSDIRFPVDHPDIVARAVATKQMLVANDITEEEFDYGRPFLPETRSQVAVPLRVGDDVTGVLVVRSDQAGAFDAGAATPFRFLGDQVAIALTNARLFRKTLVQYEVMEALHEISVDITSRLEVGQVISAIVRHAARLLRTESAALCVCEPDDLLRLVAQHDLPTSPHLLDLDEVQTAFRRVIATGRPVIINTVRSCAEPRFQERPIRALVAVPMLWKGNVIGVLSILNRSCPFIERDGQLLILLANLASAALNNAKLYSGLVTLTHQLEQKVAERAAELAAAREELQRLLAVTVELQEEERARIARDLHDGSNQLITGTLFEIQAAAESIRGDRGEAALRKLETAKELLRQLDAENRRIIAGIRPIALDTHGLVAALQKQADAFAGSHQVRCSFKLSGRAVRMAQEVETAIYRIVQESLHNAAAHSNASSVEVRLAFRSRMLEVVVEDNGKGFDVDSVCASPTTQLGLLGMRERAQNMGGELKVDSCRGRGTRVLLELPLPVPAPVPANRPMRLDHEVIISEAAPSRAGVVARGGRSTS